MTCVTSNQEGSGIYDIMGGKTTVPERIVPGSVDVATFREHGDRYRFASRFVPGRKVLDAACGVGIGSSCLLRAGAANCLGVDISPDAISYAIAHYPGPRFLIGDVARLPVDDNSIDVVVSFETIEHVPDPAAFLAECRRVLAPGGLFIGSTPHEPLNHWISADNPFHLHAFSDLSFAELLTDYFGEVHLYAQSLTNYPCTVVKGAGLHLLRATRLLDLALRVFRKSDLLTLETSVEYDLSTVGNSIQRYTPSWMWQPAVTIAVARKP